MDGRDGARCSDFDGSREVAAASEIAALVDGARADVSARGRRSHGRRWRGRQRLRTALAQTSRIGALSRMALARTSREGDRRRSRRRLGRGLGRMDRRRSRGRDRKGRGDRGGRGHDRKGEGSWRGSRSPGCFLVGSTRTRGRTHGEGRTKTIVAPKRCPLFSLFSCIVCMYVCIIGEETSYVYHKI